MKKQGLMVTGMVSLAVLATACGDADNNAANNNGSDNEDAPDDVTLRLAHTGSGDHQYNIAAEHFADLVDEKTDGAVDIDIHGDATLGGEDEAIEQVIDGTLDMTTVAADSSFANTVPEMNLFGLPYIFEDIDHAYETMDGDVGQELLDEVEEHGMIGMDYWEVGLRHVSTNEGEIHSPDDMEGMSIRVQPSPVWEAHMEALGASPTPVDFDELYSALDQGVVDGQENPLATIDSMNFYEVQDYVSMTGHTYSPAIVVMSENAEEELGGHFEDVQAAVEETTEFHREELAEREEEIISTLEDEGVTITEDPDFEAFQEATEEVRDMMEDEVPADLVDRVVDRE
ncbi:DctP family TRAP transporter solute-binding subunit [Salisediminibacterium halotolerans]|uniref:Tripartite ATP-independent transporter solute receptor, DctP family n=1 Tax=Salisediminibacterium halotolerans TaxID=517425 RepID=A0A1H9UC77_9BACI|nr:DctP family TRAP transporter solute-binding subunit [Salisediminibacterium haloalkalitolerans]SES06693.1 tripartite ATP-independent transporter solute receptor, DctP family [Salisediminibacterium haloalkalitolerans]